MPAIKLRYEILITLLLLFLLIVAIISNIDTIGKQLYPIKYQDLISKYSYEYGLDPRLVAAIIKVESKFNTDAESSKAAKGLMQITPQTGRWAAKEIGIENYNDELLNDPEVNIRIGCWYLDNLKSQFKDIELVIAAYNGGSGNVTKWLSDSRYSHDRKKLHSIPFKETEEYVDKVVKNFKIYKRLYTYKSFYE